MIIKIIIIYLFSLFIFNVNAIKCEQFIHPDCSNGPKTSIKYIGSFGSSTSYNSKIEKCCKLNGCIDTIYNVKGDRSTCHVWSINESSMDNCLKSESLIIGKDIVWVRTDHCNNKSCNDWSCI